MMKASAQPLTASIARRRWLAAVSDINFEKSGYKQVYAKVRAMVLTIKNPEKLNAIARISGFLGRIGLDALRW